MIEEPAGRAVRRMHGADEAPRVRQQLPRLRRPHLHEERASMDRSAHANRKRNQYLIFTKTTAIRKRSAL